MRLNPTKFHLLKLNQLVRIYTTLSAKRSIWHKVIVLYAHLLIHAEIYIYILDTYWHNKLFRRNDKDAMINRSRKTSLTIFTSHFIARVRKGCVGFYCERELETEHNWNILTPKLWPSALCLSRSPGLLNRSPGVHSAGCWLSFLQLVYSHSNSNSTRLSSFCSIRRPYITFKLPRGDMDMPLRLRNFFRYLVIGMCHFRYLWNGLCDRSSDNNCHAVQRSLSSGASVYESIIGFFFLPRPISSANFRPRNFLS